MSVDNTNQYVKIPVTPIIDNYGNIAREWIYFFNEIGKVIDQTINANLSEMTKTLLESANNSELSLQAIPMKHSLLDVLDNVMVWQAGSHDDLAMVDVGLPLIVDLKNQLLALEKQQQLIIEEIQKWQLLINS